MTSEGLIQVVQLAISLGASIAGRVKEVVDVLFPGHTLTNDEINALEVAAQADDARRIARRTAPADQ